MTMILPPLTAYQLRTNILWMLDQFREIEHAVRGMVPDLDRALAAERNK